MCGAPVSSTGQALRVLSADSAAAEGPRRSSSRATAQSNRPFEPGRSGGSRELLASAKRARSSRLKPLPQQRLWREGQGGPGLENGRASWRGGVGKYVLDPVVAR